MRCPEIDKHANLGRLQNEQLFKKVTPLCNLIQSRNCPLCFNYTDESLFHEARVSFDEERKVKGTKDHNDKLK
jgi:hypothetical protein